MDVFDEFRKLLKRCFICQRVSQTTEFPSCAICKVRVCKDCKRSACPQGSCSVCLNPISMCPPSKAVDFSEVEKLLEEASNCLDSSRRRQLDRLEPEAKHLGYPCKLCGIPKMGTKKQWCDHMNGKNHERKLANASRRERNPKRRRSPS